MRLALPILAMALAMVTLAPTPPAYAFSFAVDCRDTSLSSGLAEGYRRQKGIIGLMLNYKKRQADAYQLISANNGVMMQVWSGLMCAATGGDRTAAQLRNRWSQAIGRTSDGFTIGRAYDYYMQRVRYSAPDATRILSGGERALIVETLAYMESLSPQYARPRYLLTEKLGL